MPKPQNLEETINKYYEIIRLQLAEIYNLWVVLESIIKLEKANEIEKLEIEVELMAKHFSSQLHYLNNTMYSHNKISYFKDYTIKYLNEFESPTKTRLFNFKLNETNKLFDIVNLFNRSAFEKEHIFLKDEKAKDIVYTAFSIGYSLHSKHLSFVEEIKSLNVYATPQSSDRKLVKLR